MNTENLEIGQVFKNYKELCSALEIEPKTNGKSRKLQEEDIKRYIEYHLEKRNYVIDKIYEKAEEKFDKRKLGNNNQQAKYLRYLICNLVSRYNIKEDEILHFSKGLLLRKVNLVNENYVIAKSQTKEYSKQINVSSKDIRKCIAFIDDRNMKAIKRALNILKEDKTLEFEYSYTYVNKQGAHQAITEVQKFAIEEAEEEVKKMLGLDTKMKLYYNGKWEKYKSEVVKYLRKKYTLQFHDLKYYYTSYHFTYKRDLVQKKMRYMEQEQGITFKDATKQLNKIWNKSLENAINNNVKLKTEEEKIIHHKVKNSVVKNGYPKIKTRKEISKQQEEEELNQLEIVSI